MLIIQSDLYCISHQALLVIKVKVTILLIIVIITLSGASNISIQTNLKSLIQLYQLVSYIDQMHLKQPAYYSMFCMCQ